MKFFKKLFFLSCMILLPSLSGAMPEKPLGRISDFSNVLNENTKQELDNSLKKAEEKSSAEIAVVTVPSLENITVEEYANKLFNLWKIGKKGKDNGVLVLVAPNEKKIRIEVGYGLEAILPDGLAGEVIRQEFLPSFKQGDFNDGIKNGVKRICEIIEHPEEGKPSSQIDSISFSYLFPFLILAFLLAPWISRFFGLTRNLPMGRRYYGGSWGGGGWSGGSSFGGFGGGSSGGGGASGSW